MQHIGCNDDHRAAPNWLAGEFIRSERNTTYSGDGRIEPVRLIDHGARLNEPIGHVAVAVAVNSRSASAWTRLPPFGRLRQQKQRPSDTISRRFVAGGDEGEDIRANPRLRSGPRQFPDRALRAIASRYRAARRAGSAAIRRRRVETIVSIAVSKRQSIGRTCQRLSRGTTDGKSSTSNGSIRPIVSK